MPISSLTTPRIQYAGSGTSGPFDVIFIFDQGADLKVIKTSTLGVDTVLTLTADYTVTGGNIDVGEVTLLSPLLSGEILTIIRNTVKTQETDYVENDRFAAEDHERALNKLTLITQDMSSTLSRVPTLADSSDSSASLTLPEPTALKYLRWNSDASALENVTGSGGGGGGSAEIDTIGDGLQLVSNELSVENSIYNKITLIEDNADVTDETNVIAALNGATISLTALDSADKILIQDTSDTNSIKYITPQSIADLYNETFTELSQDTSPTLGNDLDLDSNDITGSGNINITGTITSTDAINTRFIATDGAKLDTIESNATADQTGSEIKTLYEDEADTNAYTDSEKTKLSGIETSATADMTDSEIKAAYENNADTNAFTDSNQTKLSGIETSADVTDIDISSDSGTTSLASGDTLTIEGGTNVTTSISGDTVTINASGGGGGGLTTEEAEDIVGGMFTGNTETLITATYEDSDGTIDLVVDNDLSNYDNSTSNFITSASVPVDSVNGNTGVVVLDADDISDAATTNKFTTSADISKLSGIESGATADQTGSEIKSAYEAEANTNAYTDSEKTKLSGIESGATGDQSDSEIKTAYENNSNTNAFTDAEQAKLSGIETSADVTDETNVVSSLDGATLTSVTVTGTDKVIIQDDSDSDSIKTVTAQAIADLGGGGGGGGLTSTVISDTTLGSTASTLEYTDLDDYKAIDINLIHVESDAGNRELRLQVSTDNGSTWKTSGYVSNLRLLNIANASKLTSTSHVSLTGGTSTGSNAGLEGVVTIRNHEDSSTKTYMNINIAGSKYIGTAIELAIGNGVYDTNGTVNAIKLYFDATDIYTGSRVVVIGYS